MAGSEASTGRFPLKPIPIAIGGAIFLGLLLLPAPGGLSPEGWSVVAVAALMIVWWMTEAIPVPATALAPIALLPILGAISTTQATSPYGDPIIFLFMGGFVLALAMERCNLHRRVALNIVARTGSQQDRIVGGFMVATAFISMWVSNTATAVMMLPVAVSVAGLMKGGEGSARFSLSLMLAIAYAASIGGVATLIGTPPNALLAGALNQSYGYDLGFARWMIIGVPVAAVMLLAAWILLTRITLRLERGEIADARALFQKELHALGPWSQAEVRVALVFVVTASAWMFRTLLDDYVPGLNDTSIAIAAALALFLIPSGVARGGALVDWDTAKRLPWDVLILFGGGLSLAAAVTRTGVDDWIGSLLGVAASPLPLIGIVVVVALTVLVLTEFTSNTATAAAFIPLLAALAVNLGENPLLLTVPAALAASMAFMLPVATPPNAIVFGSGFVTIPQMARQGFWLNVAAVAVISTLAYGLMVTLFGVTVGALPEWAAPAAGAVGQP